MTYPLFVARVDGASPNSLRAFCPPLMESSVSSGHRTLPDGEVHLTKPTRNCSKGNRFFTSGVGLPFSDLVAARSFSLSGISVSSLRFAVKRGRAPKRGRGLEES